MDLGIKGRRAIVCASSKGLGRACAMQLANEGVHVTLTARGAETLKKTADEIRKAHPGVTVTEVAGDITTPQGRADVLKACPDQTCHWLIYDRTKNHSASWCSAGGCGARTRAKNYRARQRRS